MSQSSHFSFATSRVLWNSQFEQGKIFGTWDFKWPSGCEIRVAFQEPNPQWNIPEFVRSKIQACAERWNDVVWKPDNKAFKPRIRLSFEKDLLPYPSSTSEAFAKSVPSGGSGRLMEYDVLVSIAPLPTSGARFGKTSEHIKIKFPTAQLGRFALRADYGTPTVFLGRPEDQEGSYFDEPVFEAIVVHEFGHVLGLPHVHQSPLSQLSFKSAGDIRAELKKHDLDVDDEYVRTQVLGRWPATRTANGGVLFSDWLPPTDSKGHAMQESVMNHVYLNSLLTNSGASKTFVPLTEPQLLDKKLLVGMYGGVEVPSLNESKVPR